MVTECHGILSPLSMVTECHDMLVTICKWWLACHDILSPLSMVTEFHGILSPLSKTECTDTSQHWLKPNAWHQSPLTKTECMALVTIDKNCFSQWWPVSHWLKLFLSMVTGHHWQKLFLSMVTGHHWLKLFAWHQSPLTKTECMAPVSID